MTRWNRLRGSALRVSSVTINVCGVEWGVVVVVVVESDVGGESGANVGQSRLTE